MDLVTFQRLLEQCGTDLDAWPDGGGAAALELMAASIEAREAYLAAYPGSADRAFAEEADGALVERIMRAVADDRG